MMMKKKTATATRTTVRKRAWRLIRVALIWARKGGAFKQSLLLSLKLGFKNITNHHHHHQKRLHNFEREFSFNETPSFRFKLHRPRIPCIDFHDDDHDQDYDDNDAVVFFNRYGSYDHHNKDDEDDHNIQEEEEQQNDDHDDDEELMEIDSKAEEFIAKFYQDMKLQRQVSLIQYNDMLLRSIS